jgi:cGMP-dependent protein kinase
MVYEFVAGGVPFGEEIDDTFKIYEAVLQQRLAYPSSVRRMAQLTNLIGILLNRNPALRQDPVRLKKHRFFADFNWDDL